MLNGRHILKAPLPELEQPRQAKPSGQDLFSPDSLAISAKRFQSSPSSPPSFFFAASLPQGCPFLPFLLLLNLLCELAIQGLLPTMEEGGCAALTHPPLRARGEKRKGGRKEGRKRGYFPPRLRLKISLPLHRGQAEGRAGGGGGGKGISIQDSPISGVGGGKMDSLLDRQNRRIPPLPITSSSAFLFFPPRPPPHLPSSLPSPLHNLVPTHLPSETGKSLASPPLHTTSAAAGHRHFLDPRPSPAAAG